MAPHCSCSQTEATSLSAFTLLFIPPSFPGLALPRNPRRNPRPKQKGFWLRDASSHLPWVSFTHEPPCCLLLSCRVVKVRQVLQWEGAGQ